jgi:hypothetical protein
MSDNNINLEAWYEEVHTNEQIRKQAMEINGLSTTYMPTS